MSTKTVSRTKQRSRSSLDPSVPRKVAPAVITLVDQGTANVVQVTFNTAVMLKGTPGWKGGLGGSATVTNATLISATVVELTFSGGTAANPVIVPADDPAIRTMSGGFVPAGNYTITP